ncbi:MAG: FtsX-like permease family protein [Clostridia bacterium]|nr:FtsX-like permease family protein [Clostridia bacterium]
MRKRGFYPRLALRSLRLNGKFYLPYLLSGVVSAAMLYDILFLNMNTGVARLKGANAVQGLLGFGALIVALFSFALICYTNGFLMKRRQKELGLYNILGMEKRHLARLLFWETVFSAFICILGGLLLGILLSKLFLLLLCAVMRVDVAFGFEVPGDAVLYTGAGFGIIFLLTYLLNLLRLRRVKPIELLKGGETGEREPKTKWLLAVLGLVTTGAGYYLSITARDPMNALELFFLAVVLVIIGTFCLFTAGSIALLKALRKNRKYYYQTRHFTAVSGMLHRMKRNAAGLATICILSTMVLVTVSTTLCLYMGVSEILDLTYSRDVQTYVNYGAPEDLPKIKAVYEAKAAEYGVKMENFAALCFYAPATEHINNRTDIDPFLAKVDGNGVAGDSADGPMRVYVGCDLAEDADASLFAAAVEVAIGTGDLDLSSRWVFTDDSRSGRIDFWASLGGFFFIGLFLGSLFLMAAVLIVYYKQVSEGYEDARSFVIMQQVGMTQREVKSSIKSQISLVFFLPLLAAACHTAGAFPMTKLILTLFGLSNTGLFGLCSLVTILIFAVVYYLIYRLTAREYYRIVRR